MNRKKFEESIAKLEKEKRELIEQLDDEKRKSEDLQFRVEEESIEKSELQVLNFKFQQIVLLFFSLILPTQQ